MPEEFDVEVRLAVAADETIERVSEALGACRRYSENSLPYFFPIGAAQCNSLIIEVFPDWIQ